MTNQKVLKKHFMFVLCIFLFVNGCFSYSSLTDVKRQNDEHNSLTSALKDLNKDFLRHLTNQENLVVLAISRTISILSSDMATMKKTIMDTDKKMNEVKQHFETALKGVKSEILALKQPILEYEKRMSDINVTVRDIQKQYVDFINEESIQKGEIKNMKKEIKVLKEHDVDHNKHITEMNISINELQNEQATLNDDFLTDMKSINTTALQLLKEIQFELKNVSVSMSNLDRELKSDLNNMSVTLSDVKKTNVEIKTNVSMAIEESGAVSNTIQNLTMNILKNERKQDTLDAELKKFQSDMNIKIAGLTTKVGFTAGMTNSGRTAKITMEFPKVIYNEGGGYDSRTSIFTAPVAGHYVFYVAVVSMEYTDLYYDICVRGTSKVRTMSWRPTGIGIFQTGTNMVVNYLQKGDKVWIKRNSGNGDYTQYVPITTFSGFLL